MKNTKTKDYEKALLLSDKLIDFIPIFPDSYLLKADLLADMQKHEEAIKYFEIAENMEEEIKEDQYIQYLKAQSQIEDKKYTDAIETLKKITKLYGENPFFDSTLPAVMKNWEMKKCINTIVKRGINTGKIIKMIEGG